MTVLTGPPPGIVRVKALYESLRDDVALLAEPVKPLVGGPPALVAAIDDNEDGSAPTIYVPLVLR